VLGAADPVAAGEDPLLAVGDDGVVRRATTLNSRFVGVTAGLGTFSTLSCTGSRNTAPDTPTGVVTTAIKAPAMNPNSSA
jgi:hypothetical protein